MSVLVLLRIWEDAGVVSLGGSDALELEHEIVSIRDKTVQSSKRLSSLKATGFTLPKSTTSTGSFCFYFQLSNHGAPDRNSQVKLTKFGHIHLGLHIY
jgi:hypothetical protein